MKACGVGLLGLALTLVTGAATAYACNGANLATPPAAGPGETVPYTMYDTDDGATYVIKVDGIQVAQGSKVGSGQLEGSFEMPDLGDRRRTVYVAFYLEHGAHEPPDTFDPIEYRPPSPPAAADGATQPAQEPAVAEPRQEPAAQTPTPERQAGPGSSETTVPRTTPQPTSVSTPRGSARPGAGGRAERPALPRAAATTPSMRAPQATPAEAAVPELRAVADRPPRGRSSSHRRGSPGVGLLRPDPATPQRRSAAQVRPESRGDGVAIAVGGTAAVVALLVPAILWWRRRGRPGELAVVNPPDFDPAGAGALEAELQQIIAEEHARSLLGEEPERGPPVVARR